ncbi:MAG: hypothetical protein CVU29_11295 [Betaproteobacteria bacterium HGW-Betaproteobacteria-22]|nr:MAG: hypothetical protein CVU29_11295 [Betaproteobacteria bacterium HGW-Betaproteobacteria-22]
MKQAATKNDTTSNSLLSIRIIKLATCPTCSGKATLTYHLGCTTDNAIYFRVYSNSGGGFFSPEWIKLADIQAALAKAPQPITSYALTNLFKGKSVNTPGFLMATLKQEGLVKLLEGKIRGYELIAPSLFMLEVNKLVASDIDLKLEPVVTIKKSATTLSPKKAKSA